MPHLVKKRNIFGVRPQFTYQSGDALGRKAFFSALRKSGKFSDTKTMSRSESGKEQSKSKAGNREMPRNMSLMMTLNEVAKSSMNGGGAIEKNWGQRLRPEFILACDNRQDCFKILNAFKDIFSRDLNENKEDNYDLTWLKSDKGTNLLSTTLEKYILNETKKRSNSKAKKTISLEQVEKGENNEGKG